jgi:F0F1-type ATP synthase membrane subunit c/vacuolar-type H+-ATPase subunit K
MWLSLRVLKVSSAWTAAAAAAAVPGCGTCAAVGNGLCQSQALGDVARRVECASAYGTPTLCVVGGGSSL